jgi:hypothetical protein
MASSRYALTRLKAIFLIDLMIVGLATGGYWYIQAFLRTIVPPPEGPKPAEFVLGNLTITPAEAEVGQPIIVKVDVANVGEEPGICVLNLTINNVVEETRTVQLSGGNSTTVEFAVIKDAVGTYSVKIGDLTGTFKIVAPPSTSQPRPAAFTIYGLTISPSEGWVNDTIQISFFVRNIGDESGSISLNLTIRNSTTILYLQTITVELSGGDVTTETVTFKPNSTGTYYVAVKDLTGTFQIVPTGMHTLTIGASAINLEFKLDGETKKVPFSALLNVGEHLVEMPLTSPDGNAYFLRWDDGSANPTRRINLQSRMSLFAYYSGGSSCPSLFIWNGTSYLYVAEISNHGWLGYMNYITNNPEWPIVYWRNNPWDYLKLDKSLLHLVNGTYYEMLLSQRWNEIFYLDTAYLVVVDHPADVDVYSTGVEQYLSPDYMGKIYTVSRNPLSPVAAYNEKGEDVLNCILYRDGIFTPGVNGLLSPSWNNITWNRLTIDLGNLSGTQQIKLIVTGKVDWGSPEDYTAWIEKFFTADVPNGTQITPPPYMEIMDNDGNWIMVPWERQFPLPPDVNPRTWVVDLTGLFPADADKYVTRISNFWNVTFDYIGIDVTPQLDVVIREIYPYATLYQEFVSPSRASGNFTRYGDVTPLLLSYNDEFVIGRQGDSVRLQFPVGDLRPSEEGMERTFFLFVACWFKDENGNWGYGFDFTADPLPFKDMSGFPYPLDKESYPYELHWAYLTTYNTRVVEPPKDES